MNAPTDKCERCRWYRYGYCPHIRTLYEAKTSDDVCQAMNDIVDCSWVKATQDKPDALPPALGVAAHDTHE